MSALACWLIFAPGAKTHHLRGCGVTFFITYFEVSAVRIDNDLGNRTKGPRGVPNYAFENKILQTRTKDQQPEKEKEEKAERERLKTEEMEEEKHKKKD